MSRTGVREVAPNPPAFAQLGAMRWSVAGGCMGSR